jgi:stearoyl-CoA desaturase (delta-9 desaturase)
MFRFDERSCCRYTGDLRKDGAIRRVSRLFLVWGVLGLVVPAIIAGLVTGTWLGVLLGFIWGGLVRVFFGHHVTWSINSICHLWGTRPFKCADESRNNALFGVLAFGEGWHNNHHAFPTSARHGLRWWQIDVSYLFIRGMGLCGLARDIRVPGSAQLHAKRTTMASA